MFTDTQIAKSLIDLYAGGAGVDYYEPGQGANGVCWALIKTPDGYLYQLRGSATLLDWIRDFDAVAVPFEHNKFGEVHPGFLLGMSDTADKMLSLWDEESTICISGHSLGAARASIIAAEFIQRGIPAAMIRTVTFGQPKPGMQFLSDYIQGVRQVSYRNSYAGSHDVVTSLALTLPGMWYVHPKPLTDISVGPDPGDITCLALHHMPLYLKGLPA